MVEPTADDADADGDRTREQRQFVERLVATADEGEHPRSVFLTLIKGRHCDPHLRSTQKVA